MAVLEDLVLTHRAHTVHALSAMPPLPASVPALARLQEVLTKEQNTNKYGT